MNNIRVDTHRACIVDVECDDCAMEGCYLAPHPMDANQGRGPIVKVPRRHKPVGIFVVVTVAIASVFAVLMAVHFGIPR